MILATVVRLLVAFQVVVYTFALGSVVRKQQASISAMGLFQEKGTRSQDKLCKRFQWPVRSAEAPAPKIFYGIVTNGEDLPLLEAHIHQVYDFVHRFVVVESHVTQAGFESPYPAINYSSDSFSRFASKLRNITYTEAMFKERFLSECYGDKAGMSELMHASVENQKKECVSYARQNGQRKMIADGFTNLKSGVTELTANDIVIVADIDEIPTQEAMSALTQCAPPEFTTAVSEFMSGQKPCAAQKNTKVIFKAQYVYFHVDCPLKKTWWHPDAVSAVCLLHGDWNAYDVRGKGGGVMTKPVAGFHLHNVGRNDEQLEFKYKTYGEPCSGRDAICHPGHVPEMRKRTCDDTSPPLGPDNWSFSKATNTSEGLHALYDLEMKKQQRGWYNDEVANSWKSFLSIVAEKPQRYAHFFYAGRQYE